MGTAITLSLNGIDIDWGKNRDWTSHHWLFPPDSVTDVEYCYAGHVTEMKPGFQTTLGATYFRLCHLGYSQHETKTKFDATVARWNRTADLRLSYADFHQTLTSVEFAALTAADLQPYAWDFRQFVVGLLSAWDTDVALLEDFIFSSLDFNLILRVLADRVDSRDLLLRWQHQDLIDSGWASLDDLTELDRPSFIINHTLLVGRLQDYADAFSVKAFDGWLRTLGLPQTTSYTRLGRDGTAIRESTALPTAVRNMIHHPENPHNALSDDDLRRSVEMLLMVVRRLPSPLPGLP